MAGFNLSLVFSKPKHSKAAVQVWPRGLVQTLKHYGSLKFINMKATFRI